MKKDNHERRILIKEEKAVNEKENLLMEEE